MSNNVTTLARPSKNTKGTPPAPAEASANLEKAPSSGKVQLPVQVTAEVRRSFKAYAAERDITMSDLFVKMWDEYRTRNG